MDTTLSSVHTVTKKPVPTPDSESAPFWDSIRRHVLSVQRCDACGHHRLPATTYCPKCRSPEVEWVATAGRGRVFSWIVVRHPIPAEAYVGDVPYIVAIVTLDEGPRIVSNIIDCAPDAVLADMQVQVDFVQRDGFSLPVFRPVV